MIVVTIVLPTIKITKPSNHWLLRGALYPKLW